MCVCVCVCACARVCTCVHVCLFVGNSVYFFRFGCILFPTTLFVSNINFNFINIFSLLKQQQQKNNNKKRIS